MIMEAYQQVSVDEIIDIERMVHQFIIHQVTILFCHKWCYTSSIIIEAYLSASVVEIIDIEKVGPQF